MCRNSIVTILRLTLCWPLVVGAAVAADISVTSTFVSDAPTCDVTAGQGQGDYLTPDGQQRNWDDADSHCTSQGLRLPTLDELAELHSAYPSGQISTICGWPIDDSYWSSTQADIDEHYIYALDRGDPGLSGNPLRFHVTCVR